VQEKVWAQIKGTEIPFAAKVISATRNKMELAATADDIEKNIADVTLTMVAALPLAKVPKAGDETQVLGKLDSYTSSPFMINMIEGQLIAKPPAHKPSPKH